MRHVAVRVSAAAGLLMAVSLAASLIFVYSYPLPEVENDAAEYLALARNVAAGAGFTQDGATPMAYRPPLFSVLLGGWFFLTGTSSVFSTAVFQSILHALGVLAAFLLYLELAPSLAWAAGAALFLAVNPLLVTRVVFVLQEPTLLLFTTLAAWLSVRLVRAPSAGRAALAGVAWGLCTLGKAVSWFAPFLLLGLGLLPGRLRVSLRGKEAAALLFCFAAAVAPWTMRNYIHFQRFIPVNDQGYGLLEWNVMHAGAQGERLVGELREKGVPLEERREALWNHVRENYRTFLGDRVVRSAVRFVAPPRDWWISRDLVRPGERRPSSGSSPPSSTSRSISFSSCGHGGGGGVPLRRLPGSPFCSTGPTGSSMRCCGGIPGSALQSTRCSWRWSFLRPGRGKGTPNGSPFVRGQDEHLRKAGGAQECEPGRQPVQRSRKEGHPLRAEDPPVARKDPEAGRPRDRLQVRRGKPPVLAFRHLEPQPLREMESRRPERIYGSDDHPGSGQAVPPCRQKHRPHVGEVLDDVGNDDVFERFPEIELFGVRHPEREPGMPGRRDPHHLLANVNPHAPPRRQRGEDGPGAASDFQDGCPARDDLPVDVRQEGIVIGGARLPAVVFAGEFLEVASDRFLRHRVRRT